jgi:hypothetical protein
MPVPDFNSSGVLPPHLGMPTNAAELSPYPATSLEICQKLGFSADRREILRGWIQLRKLLRTLGHNRGFQWIDGSFTEDAETHRSRSPSDIDVVSFLPQSPAMLDPAIAQIIADPRQTKQLFKVDHLIVRLNWIGETIVEHTRYWCGLFSHRRDDGVWKGMLKVDLDTIADDAAAKRHLDSLGNP